MLYEFKSHEEMELRITSGNTLSSYWEFRGLKDILLDSSIS